MTARYVIVPPPPDRQIGRHVRVPLTARHGVVVMPYGRPSGAAGMLLAPGVAGVQGPGLIDGLPIEVLRSRRKLLANRDRQIGVER